MTQESDICLVLFCRRPSPGIGKQRLADRMGRGAAARAAELLLATALEDLDDWPGPVALSPARASDSRWAADLLRRPATVIAQPAGNLGERLNAVDSELRARGFCRLIYMGSDAPELRPADYAAARGALGHADVVLAPATDGGVTLMGAKRPWPDLKALPWSTNHLGEDLAILCNSSGLDVQLLDECADVDIVSDLQRSVTMLRDDPRAARQQLVRWWQAEGRQAMAAG